MAALFLSLLCILLATYAGFTTGAQWGAGAALAQHCYNPGLTKSRKVVIRVGLWDYTLTYDVVKVKVEDEEPTLEPDDE